MISHFAWLKRASYAHFPGEQAEAEGGHTEVKWFARHPNRRFLNNITQTLCRS